MGGEEESRIGERKRVFMHFVGQWIGRNVHDEYRRSLRGRERAPPRRARESVCMKATQRFELRVVGLVQMVIKKLQWRSAFWRLRLVYLGVEAVNVGVPRCLVLFPLLLFFKATFSRKTQTIHAIH